MIGRFEGFLLLSYYVMAYALHFLSYSLLLYFSLLFGHFTLFTPIIALSVTYFRSLWKDSSLFEDHNQLPATILLQPLLTYVLFT